MRVFITILITFVSLKAQLSVSILDFKGQDVEEKVLKACYNQLEESLIESNRFRVIEKREREELLKEAKWQNSGMCDEACAVEIGKNIGAKYLMIGEIIGFADLYQINIKIIDIKTGQVVEKVTNQVIGGMAVLLNGMEDASRDIVRKIASVSAPQQIMQQSGETMIIEKTYGSVDIISDPQGADILVDLVEYGVTPKTIEKIETGSHNLILNYPGYERLQKRIMVEQEKTISISEYLVPKVGSLSILTEPSGANVYIDNIIKGQAPLDLMNLPVRDYIIRLELKDYQIIERRISVQYGENTTQKFDLEPLPGKLSLFTTPSMAKININGRNYTSGSNGIASIELPVGRYTLKVTKDGYEPMQREVSIKPNDLGTLDINLKRLPAGVSSNSDMGFLTVNTLNGNTKLKISGVKETQRLPMEYFELKYGTYNLKAFGVGLENKKVMVDIERQKTTNIEINLEKKQKAKAIRYSLMFPGGGQFYEGSKRSIIYASTFIGSGLLLSNAFSTYSDDNKLLDQYQAGYNAATSADEIDATWALYEQQSIKVNDAQTKLIVLSTTLVSAWLTSIIDSYFFSGLE